MQLPHSQVIAPHSAIHRPKTVKSGQVTFMSKLQQRCVLDICDVLKICACVCDVLTP